MEDIITDGRTFLRRRVIKNEVCSILFVGSMEAGVQNVFNNSAVREVAFVYMNADRNTYNLKSKAKAEGS